MSTSECAAGSASSQRLLDVGRLASAIDRFAAERDWERFHSPKNLAMALAAEAGELVEIFQWLTEEASQRVGHREATARAVRDELADVLIYLVRLASRLEVDLDEAVRHKLARNAEKYPVERARGRADKVDRL